MEEGRKELYNMLKEDGYFNGDYSTFTANIDKPQGRQELFSMLKEDGYYNGDWETFNRNLTGDKKRYSVPLKNGEKKYFDTKEEGDAWAKSHQGLDLSAIGVGKFDERSVGEQFTDYNKRTQNPLMQTPKIGTTPKVDVLSNPDGEFEKASKAIGSDVETLPNGFADDGTFVGEEGSLYRRKTEHDKVPEIRRQARTERAIDVGKELAELIGERASIQQKRNLSMANPDEAAGLNVFANPDEDRLNELDANIERLSKEYYDLTSDDRNRVRKNIDKTLSDVDVAIKNIGKEKQDYYSTIGVENNKKRDKELNELERQFKNGSLSIFDYKKKKGEISEKYNKEYDKFNKEQQELVSYSRSARRNLNQAYDLIRQADRNTSGQTSYFGNVWHGFADKVLDTHIWDFGVQDLLDYYRQRGILQKFEDKQQGGNSNGGGATIEEMEAKLRKGQKLSRGEELYLKSVIIKSAAEDITQYSLGKGYQDGQITAEALPFMLEFYVAGGLGNAVSKGSVKMATKLTSRNAFMRGVANMFTKGVNATGKAASATGRALTRAELKVGGKAITQTANNLIGKATSFVGNQIKVGAESAAMSATTGSLRVAGNTINKMNGEADYGYDKDGNIYFTGVNPETRLGVGEALLQSYYESAKENFTEKGGGLVKATGSVAGKAVGKFLGGMGKKFGGRAYTSVENWLKRLSASQFKRKMDDFLNRTQWHGTGEEYLEEVEGNVIDAFAGLATDGRWGDGKNFKFDINAKGSVFNLEDNIDTFRSLMIMGGATSSIATIGYAVESRHRKARLDALRSLRSTRLQNSIFDVFGNERGLDVMGKVDALYADGNRPNNEEVLNVVNGMNANEAAVTLAYIGSKEREIGETIGEQMQGRDADTAVRQAIDDEVQEQAQQEKPAEEKREIAMSQEQVAQRLDDVTGGTYIREQADKFLDNNEDFFATDLGRSLDDETKEAVMQYFAAVAQLRAIEENDNNKADEAVQAEQQKLQDVPTDANGNITTITRNGIVGYVISQDGDNITYVSEEGDVYEVKESQIDRDEDNNPAYGTINLDEHLNEVWEQAHEQQKAKTLHEMQHHQNTPSMNDLRTAFQTGAPVVVATDNGLSSMGVLNITTMKDGTVVVALAPIKTDKDGNSVLDETKAQFLNYEELTRLNDEFWDSQNSLGAEAEDALTTPETAETADENETEIGDELPPVNGETVQDMSDTETDTGTTSNEAQGAITYNEEGEPNFDNATTDEAAEYFNNEDSEVALPFIDNFIADAKKNLDTINKKKPDVKKYGTKIGKFKSDLAEWQTAVDEAQAKVNYWNEVKSKYQRKYADELKEENKKKQTLAQRLAKFDFNSMTWQDYVLATIAAGLKFKGTSDGSTKGLAEHLTGRGTIGKDVNLVFIDNTNGEYPEVMAQKIWEGMPQTMKEQITDQDVFNEILDIMLHYPSYNAMIDDLDKRYDESAMQSAFDKADYDAWAEEQDSEAFVTEWLKEQSSININELLQDYADYYARQDAERLANEQDTTAETGNGEMAQDSEQGTDEEDNVVGDSVGSVPDNGRAEEVGQSEQADNESSSVLEDETGDGRVTETLSFDEFVNRLKQIVLSLPSYTVFEVKDNALVIGNKKSAFTFKFEDYIGNDGKLSEEFDFLKEELQNLRKVHEENVLLSQIKRMGDEYFEEWAKLVGLSPMEASRNLSKESILEAKQTLSYETILAEVVIPFFERKAQQEISTSKEQPRTDTNKTENTDKGNAKTDSQESQSNDNVETDNYTITKQHHDKAGKDIWVVRSKDRADKDTFTANKKKAKENNGYYSSFKGVNGFVFDTPEDAEAFAKDVWGETAEVNTAGRNEETETEETQSPKSETTSDISAKGKTNATIDAKERADVLEKEIKSGTMSKDDVKYNITFLEEQLKKQDPTFHDYANTLVLLNVYKNAYEHYDEIKNKVDDEADELSESNEAIYDRLDALSTEELVNLAEQKEKNAKSDEELYDDYEYTSILNILEGREDAETKRWMNTLPEVNALNRHKKEKESFGKDVQDAIDAVDNAYKDWIKSPASDTNFNKLHIAQDALRKLFISKDDKAVSDILSRKDISGIVRETLQKELDERAKRKVQNELFDNGIKNQGEIAGEPDKKPVSPNAFTDAKSGILYYHGQYHDPQGYGVVTNGTMLYADKRQYDESKKGKVVLTHKMGNKPKGTVVDTAPYPKWKELTDETPTATATTDVKGFLSFVAGVVIDIKERYDAMVESYKDSVSKPVPYSQYEENSIIAVRLPNGEVRGFSANRIIQFAKALQQLGVKEVLYGNGNLLCLEAKSDNGVVMIMPRSLYDYGTDSLAPAFNENDNTATAYYYDAMPKESQGTKVDAEQTKTANTDNKQTETSKVENSASQEQGKEILFKDENGNYVQRETTTEDGAFEIYSIHYTNGKVRYQVPYTADKRISDFKDGSYSMFGDTIYDTLEEAKKGVEEGRMRVQRESEAKEELRKREEEKAKYEAEEKERKRYDGFTDGMTPMQVGQVAKVLDKVHNFSGKIKSLYNHIKDWVNDGRTFSMEYFNNSPRATYICMLEDGTHYEIPKIAYDFAKFLGAKVDSEEEQNEKKEKAELYRLSEKYDYPSYDKILRLLNNAERQAKVFNDNKYKEASVELARLKDLYEKYKNNDNTLNTSESEDKEQEAEPKPVNTTTSTTPKKKIGDVGEKIGGARKDLAQSMADRIILTADTFPKMFPKFDFIKLIEQGLNPKLAATVMWARQTAMYEYKKSKRYYTNERALKEASFFASFAKQVLEKGDTDVNFTDGRFKFTDYGKNVIKLNVELYSRIHDVLGNEMFGLDLSDYEIIPISANSHSTFFRKNAEGKDEEFKPSNCAKAGTSSRYFETTKEAIDYVTQRLQDSVSYKKAHPYNIYVYEFTSKGKRTYFVGAKIGNKIEHLSEDFERSSNAREYLNNNETELQLQAARIDQQHKDEKKGTDKGSGEKRWKPQLSLGGLRQRVGEDYRQGRDIGAEEFRDTFGFRGVEFGNYVTQRERQQFLNESYDALMDLAKLLNVSPRALSLNGQLGFAVGARGIGNANAHYEPNKNVINLTKKSGAGAVAHEWWHALDYFFNRDDNGTRTKAATSINDTDRFNSGVRNEMRKAFLHLMDVIKNGDYFKRSRALERKLHPNNWGEGYYDKPTELGARAFQDYVQRRLIERGNVNDFLSSFTTEEDWNGQPENYPYPKGEDATQISEAFDNLFGTMQQRTDEATGNVILYHKADNSTPTSEQDTMLRDALADIMREAGIDVITDSNEGQETLDAVNDAIKSHKVYHGSGADFDAFDHSHMGEGEGAQMYGWGTYVTEVEGIGRGYAIASAGKATYNGKIVNSADPYSDSPAERALFYMEQEHGRKEAIKFLREIMRDEDDADIINDYKETIMALQDEKNWGEPERILYTVDIPEDNGSNYIDWDKISVRAINKMLKAMTDDQKERISKIPVSKYNDGSEILDKEDLKNRILWHIHNSGWKNLYEIATLATGEKQAASELLSRAGFVGIKYPAEYHSGGRKDGAKNYVIFDEKDLKITDKSRFFRTSDGSVYGFTKGGKIYLDPRIAGSETAVHEYTHLWAEAVRKNNPELWNEIRNIFENGKDVAPLWDKVKKDYPELSGDELLEEVIAHYSGKQGSKRLNEAAMRVMNENGGKLDADTIAKAINDVRTALNRFWDAVKDFFGIENLKAEDVADMALRDLLNGVKPDAKSENIRMLWVGTKGAAREDASEGNTDRIDNLNVAKKMERAKADVKAIKFATGWERGADGKWRYEESGVNWNEETLKGILLNKRVGEVIEDEDGEYNAPLLMSDVIDDDNLFAAYPFLRKIPFYNFTEDNTLAGAFSHSFAHRSIAVNMVDAIEASKQIKKQEEKIKSLEKSVKGEFTETQRKNMVALGITPEQSVESAKKGIEDARKVIATQKALLDGFVKDFKGVLNHEVQHYIQYAEGWTTGGSSSTIRKRLTDLLTKKGESKDEAERLINVHRTIVHTRYGLERALQLFKNPKRFLKMQERFTVPLGSNKQLIQMGQEMAKDGYFEAMDNVPFYASKYDIDPKNFGLDFEDAYALMERMYEDGMTPLDIAKRGIYANELMKFYDAVVKASAKDSNGSVEIVNEYKKLEDEIKSSSDKELYIRLAGEVEARNASRRMDYTNEQRKNFTAQGTEDVSRKKQLVLDDESESFGESNSIRFSKAASIVDEYADNEKVQWLHNIDKNGGYILTDTTRIDKDYDKEDAEYNQRLAYRPIYLRRLFYADNTNPREEEYDTIEEALNDLKVMDADNSSNTFEPYNEIYVEFKEVWLDRDGYEVEEGETYNIEEIDDYDFANTPLGKYVEPIAQEMFQSAYNKYEEYEREVQSSLKDTLDKYEGVLDGEKVHLEAGKYLGKYNNIDVVDKNGEQKGVIQLRIADHSYNPRNNDSSALEGNFISVVLSNDDPTSEKYHGNYNLHYNIGEDVEYVCDGVEERIDDILSDWNDYEDRARFSHKSNSTPSQSNEIDRKSDIASMATAVESLADELHTPVNILTSEADLDNTSLPDDIKRQMKENGNGLYYNGKVYVYLPNCEDVNDAVKVTLHEVVGHGGLRKMLGEQGFNDFCHDLYRSLPKDTRSMINERALLKYGGDIYEAMDEYLAEMAERNETPTWWEKVIARLRQALRKTFGMDIDLSVNDAKYLVWQSKNQLKKNDIFSYAAQVSMRRKLGINRKKNDNDKPTPPKGGGGIRWSSVTPTGHGTNISPSAVQAAEHYNRSIRTLGYVTSEAFQDSMQGLKNFLTSVMEASKKKFEDIKDWENPYIFENHMASINEAEFQSFNHLFAEPLMKTIVRITKGDYKQAYNDMKVYMMAKHGLERNEVFAERDAKKDIKYDKRLKEIGEAASKQIDFDNRLKNATSQAEIQALYDELDNIVKPLEKALKDELNNKIIKYREHDYSGLTSLFADDVTAADPTLADYEEAAKNYVDAYESSHDADLIKDLWDNINACNAAIIAKQREGGLITSEQEIALNTMFKYYIPLRGFDETTSDEVYDYLLHDNNTPFSKVTRTAKGRKSIADDPIATMANMAENSITSGNRNKLKQMFMRFILNHPSDAAVVTDVYYHKTTDEQGNEVYKILTPQIEDTDDIDTVNQKVAYFKQDMEEKCKNQPDEYVKQSDKPTFEYRTMAQNKSEHQVTVFSDGKQHTITITGDPRAAQAINGLTNPEVEDAKDKIIMSVTRWIAQVNTTLNPEFVVSNFARDTWFAGTMVWVREDPKYALRYNLNWWSALGRIWGLTRRFNQGKLDLNNEWDKMFHDFVMGGGRTGYTAIQNIEKHKQLIQDALSLQNGGVKSTPQMLWNFITDIVKFMNESVENIARFATFVTSREMGRTMLMSVHDAKQVSVNFNKKGAGYKSMGDNRNKVQNTIGLLAGLCRLSYVFFNAGVQGMQTFSEVARKHPFKFSVMASLHLALPILVSLLNEFIAGDDDDEEKNYWNLPDYERRNNICIFDNVIGNGFIKIPLPIELRAIYGLGDIFYGNFTGKNKTDVTKTAQDVTSQLMQLAPIDPLSENGFMEFVPTVFRPEVELFANQDWTGKPIYKDSEFDEGKTRWQKAFSNTNPMLVGASKKLVEWTGENAYDASAWGNARFLDPSGIEHLLNGYFGGVFNFFSKTSSTVYDAATGEDINLRRVPFASRFYSKIDEAQMKSRLQNYYYGELDDRVKRFRNQKKGLENEIIEAKRMHDVQKEAELITQRDKLLRSNEVIVSELYKRYGTPLKRLKEAEKQGADVDYDVIHLIKSLKDTVSDLDKAENKK